MLNSRIFRFTFRRSEWIRWLPPIESASPSLAFALSRVTQETHGGTPVGIFRDVQRPVYDELMAGQIAEATEKLGAGELGALLHSGETWTIS